MARVEFNNGYYIGEVNYNDDPHGKGTYYYANGDKYEGMFENNQRHGKGTYYYANGDKYVGMWKNGKAHGKGTFYWADGEKYVGMWENDQKHGKGTYYWADGDRYEGDWKNDKKHGKGTFYCKDGNVYDEYYKNGEVITSNLRGGFAKPECSNKGVCNYPSGARYEGEFKPGTKTRHGYGVYYYADGKTKKGKWANGVWQG